MARSRSINLLTLGVCYEASATDALPVKEGLLAIRWKMLVVKRSCAGYERGVDPRIWLPEDAQSSLREHILIAGMVLSTDWARR